MKRLSTTKHFLLAACVCLLAAGAMAQGRRPGFLNRRSGGGRAAAPAAAEAPAPTEDEAKDAIKNAPKGTNGVPALVFNQAPLELVLDAYAEQCGKTIIPAPDLPKVTITLKSLEGQTLTKEEYLGAIEVALRKNGVVLEGFQEPPFKDKFMQALQYKTLRTQGNPLLLNMPEKLLPETGRVVSQMIHLNNISAEEAQKALEGFKDPNGLFQVFERSNTILVTDTQENINRMLSIIKELDVAAPVTEEVFVKQIEFAVAADIKTALETIVTESQKDTGGKETAGAKTSGALGFGRSAPSAPQPGRLLNLNNRPGMQKPEQPVNTPNATMTAGMSDADRGMIRGKVLILADERSNKLIVITSKANWKFFEKIIEQLDVETTPEFSVEVIRLKYADAEEVASMLNDLIGRGGSSQSKNNPNAAARPGASTASKNLTTGNRTTPTPTARPTTGTAAKSTSSLGALNTDNVKILSDKRINGIVVMAHKSAMKDVKDVIEDMDVKLSQVLIETVIIEVTLGDDLTTGIDWVQRGKYRQKRQVQKTDAQGRKLYWTTETDDEGNEISKETTDGSEGNTPIMVTITETIRDGFFNHGGSNAGYMLGGGAGSSSATLGGLLNAASSVATNDATLMAVNPIAGGINYYLKSDKLNLGAVIQAAKSDSHAKYLASPIIMTVDNKEATVEATESRKFYSGSTVTSSTYNPTTSYNYSDKDIGIKIKVTPKINPNGTVMLTVEEEYSQLGAGQTVLVGTANGGANSEVIDTALSRKMSADVLLDNRQSVVLGGLTETYKSEKESGIPILKDIPWVGKWLFGSVSQTEQRKELLVFMTPYVLDDADAAQLEAIRRKKALSDSRPWEDNGWSTSPLADPISRKEQLRRLNEEWARQDEERKTQLAIEKAKMERMKKLGEMSEAERKAWLEIHKEELEKEEKEAFEKEAKEQENLRGFVDGLKKKDLEKAEAAIEEAKTKEKNEYQKMVEEKAKDGTPPPRGEMLKKDVESAKKEAAEAKKEAEKEATEAKKEAEKKTDKPVKPSGENATSLKKEVNSPNPAAETKPATEDGGSMGLLGDLMPKKEGK